MQLPCDTPTRALNAMLSEIVHASGSGLRIWITVQHISYARRSASQESRNLDQTGDSGATDAGTCVEFFKGPRVYRIRRTRPSSHREHDGRAGTMHRRCRESACFYKGRGGKARHLVLRSGQAHLARFQNHQRQAAARHCKVKTRLKTTNALLDIHSAIASLLNAFVGERKSGFPFASRTGLAAGD
jgi:hypothetical protein